MAKPQVVVAGLVIGVVLLSAYLVDSNTSKEYINRFLEWVKSLGMLAPFIYILVHACAVSLIVLLSDQKIDFCSSKNW